MIEYLCRIGRGLAQQPRSLSDTRAGMTSVLLEPNSVAEKREDITITTWNVRTLRAAGKVEELLHEMDRYKWSILGLCEMRWNKSGEIPTDGGHRVYSSGKEDNHEQGVGFLAHKDIVKSFIGCRPISSSS